MEKVFRDPVHNLMGFDRERDRLVLELIETQELQRLRRIKLMGVSDLVYPGADHNRFSHSLGAAFLMKRIVERLEGLEREPGFGALAAELREHRELLLSAALLHDIGHYPLSHLLERFTGESHEAWTVRLLENPEGQAYRVLRSTDPNYPRQVGAIVGRTFKPSFAVKLIASQLDVDRLDYLLRDSYHTGVGYGQFDLEWLLHSLRLVERGGDWEIAVDREKGLRAVESYVLARYYMYQQVYHHRASRAAGAMVLKILERAAQLLLEGRELFAPGALRALIAQPHRLTPEQFLELDDVVLAYALREWRGSADPVLADLCGRFLARRIFKTVEVEAERYREVEAELGARARERGFDPAYYLVLDRAVSDPYVEGLFRGSGEAEECIYLTDQELNLYELSEHSELIRAVTDRLMVRDRLCFPEGLRGEVARLMGEERFG